MPQHVCTTICSLQSSLDRRLFVVGTQPLGIVVVVIRLNSFSVTLFIIYCHN